MKKIWCICVLCITVFVVVFFARKRYCGSENQKCNIDIINGQADLLGFSNPVGLGESEILDLPGFENPAGLDQRSQIQNLVNILEVDNTILIDLKYATTDNFTGMVLYDGIDCAYLQTDVAQMLANAHHYLKSLHPNLRLLVYDALRPLSVQRTMWEHVKNTPYHRYVAHPDRLSLHNFGAAVDLTIAGSLGQPLDMGTPFDHFGRAAGISDEEGLISQGILTRQQVQNRQLLRQVMRHAGFRSISGEWWHFNACSLQEAKQRYELIDIPHSPSIHSE